MIGSDFRIKEDPKDNIRAEIAKKTNRDTLSFLGVQADVAGLLVAIQLADMVAIDVASKVDKADKADTFINTKMAILQSLSPNTNLTEIAAGFLEKIKSGEVVLTASLKGLENVVEEALSDSTIVSKILGKAGS